MSQAWRKWQNSIWLLVIALLLWWSVSGMDWGMSRLTWGATSRILRMMFIDAEWSYTREMVGKMIETIQMAILGTLLASFLAVPFGFLAAKNTGKKLSTFGKFLTDLIRVFPEVILGFIFMKGVGPGPLAGILAMGFHSIGMLGKLYGEAVEAIDRGPMEALTSTGANRVQQVWYAVIPQVMPEFASYAIYRLEINARAATILGIVGAGGIGAPLIFAITSHAWERVGIILMGIIVVVSSIDYLSSWLRKKLI